MGIGLVRTPSERISVAITGPQQSADLVAPLLNLITLPYHLRLPTMSPINGVCTSSL